MALTKAINAARRRNAAAAGTKSDTSYKYNWNRFKPFVNKKRQENIIPSGDKYLTRRNADYLFTEFVPKLKVELKTASHIFPSLQFYANSVKQIDKQFKVVLVDVRDVL